nr:MAG: RNA-dependent RNA polymerase [Riboviria sp.]
MAPNHSKTTSEPQESFMTRLARKTGLVKTSVSTKDLLKSTKSILLAEAKPADIRNVTSSWLNANRTIRDNKDRMINNLVFTLGQWVLTPPSLSTVVIELVKFIDAFFHVFTVSWDQVLLKVTHFIKNIMALFATSPPSPHHIETPPPNSHNPLLSPNHTRTGGRSALAKEGVQSILSDFSTEHMAALVSGLGITVGGLLAGLGLTAFDSGLKHFTKLGNAMRSIKNIEMGCGSLITFVTNIFEFAKDKISQFLDRNRLTKSIAAYEAKGIDIKALYDNATAFMDPLMSSEASRDVARAETARDILTRFNRIEWAMINGLAVEASSRQVVSALYARFLNYLKTTKFDEKPGNRITPFNITLTGPPGCGKSIAMRVLASAITDPRAMENSPLKQNSIYGRNGSDAFWSRYDHSDVVLFDDVGATRGSTPKDSEYLAYLMIHSGVDYPLNMPDLESKGMLFTSLVTIASTNNPYPVPAELVTHTAFWRRRDLLVNCWVKPGGKATESKDWRYGLMDPNTNNMPTQGNGFGIDELIRVCCVRFEQHYHKGKKLLEQPDIDFSKEIDVDALCAQAESFSVENLKIHGPKCDYKIDFPKRKGNGRREATFASDLPACFRGWTYNEIYEYHRYEDIDWPFDNVSLTVFAVNAAMTPAVLLDIPEEWEEDEEELVDLDVEPDPRHFEEPSWHSEEIDLFGDAIFLALADAYDGSIAELNIELWRALGLKVEGPQLDYSVAGNPLPIFFIEDGDIFYGYPNSMDDSFTFFDGTETDPFLIYMVKEVAKHVNTREALGDSDTSSEYSDSISDWVETEDDERTFRYPSFAKLRHMLDAKNESRFRELEDFEETSWWTTWEDSSTMRKTLMVALGVLAALLSATAAFSAYKYLFPPQPQALGAFYSPESFKGGVTERVGLFGYETKPGMAKNDRVGLSNVNVETLARGKIANNQVAVAVTSLDGEVYACSGGLFVGGRTLVLPYHIFSKFEPEDTLKITLIYANNVKTAFLNSPSERQQISYNDKVYDMIVINADPGAVQAHTNLVKQMPSISQLQDLDNFECMTQQVTPNGMRVQLATARMEKEAVYRAGNVKLTAAVGYTAQHIAARGDCGRPLINCSPGQDKPLVGFMVAGTAGARDSFYLPLVKEFFDRVSMSCADLPLPFDGMLMKGTPEQLLEAARTRVPDGLAPIGVVGPKYALGPNNRSRMQKTVLHGECFPNTYEIAPVRLSAKGVSEKTREAGITPQEKADAKFAVEVAPFDLDSRDFAKRTMKQRYGNVVSKEPARKLTLDEAINGTSELTGINISTSPGMFSQKDSGTARGKRAYLRVVGGDAAYANPNEIRYEVDTSYHAPTMFSGTINRGEKLLEEIAQIERDLEEHGETNIFVSSTLKDETLPAEKVAEGKCRTFNVFELSLTLVTRMYFGAFIGAIGQYPAELPCSVGINPLGQPWTHLRKRLKKVSSKIIAGDYSKFDGMMPGSILMDVAEVINDWYRKNSKETPEEIERGCKARVGLVLAFIHKYVLSTNVVYQTKQGMPSGAPITAPLNSLVNELYLTMAIYELAKEAGRILTPSELIELVALAVYGDDCLLAVDSSLQKWIDFRTLRDWLGKHGIKFTPEDKDGADYDFRNIDNEVTYLKRKFVPHSKYPDKILAPLDSRVIENMTNWSQRGAQDRCAFMNELIDNALSELFHHGSGAYATGLTAINAGIASHESSIMTDPMLESTLTKFWASDYKERELRWLQEFQGIPVQRVEFE